MSDATHGANPRVERWGLFETALPGPSAGNPFLEVQLSASFSQGHRVVEVAGFYDGVDAEGRGIYRLRFMPDTPGAWTYVTESNRAALDGREGALVCVPPSPANHGPVRVRDRYHLAYADGAPHWSVGTTCYAWVHQGEALEARTLATLREAPFNKVRMCVFPKHYAFCQNEPAYHAFQRVADGGWDWMRFEPRFFQHLERRVGELCALGIEADLILFHPYDRWGFSRMDAATDERYLRYLVARLAAYRNVWWSLANEYDLMVGKSEADWDRFFHIVRESDPYQHLRSIHNCRVFYDHGKPWVTHASIQRPDPSLGRELRQQYGKPILYDECQYEGNIEKHWGNISARELVHRFWLGTVAGCYVGHGETYMHPEDILWWAKGGRLYGQSPARIAFLREILESGPGPGLEPLSPLVARAGAGYYLVYLGVHQPARWFLDLPEEGEYVVEVIDTWEMTIQRQEGTFRQGACLALPGKPYLALRIRRAS